MNCDISNGPGHHPPVSGAYLGAQSSRPAGGSQSSESPPAPQSPMKCLSKCQIAYNCQQLPSCQKKYFYNFFIIFFALEKHI